MVYVPHVCWVLMRYMLYRTNIFDMLIYLFWHTPRQFWHIYTIRNHIETAFGSGKVEILYRNITGTMTYGFKWMSVWHNRMWHNVLQAIKLCCGGKVQSVNIKPYQPTLFNVLHLFGLLEMLLVKIGPYANMWTLPDCQRDNLIANSCGILDQ